jgi:hypothetical protein
MPLAVGQVTTEFRSHADDQHYQFPSDAIEMFVSLSIQRHERVAVDFGLPEQFIFPPLASGSTNAS